MNRTIIDLDVARKAEQVAQVFEEALHDERITAEWYDKHPEYVEAWADLYGEHRVRLACLEKIAEAAR